MILKIVPKAGHECTLAENQPMRAKESQNGKLMLCRNYCIFRISVFKEVFSKKQAVENIWVEKKGCKEKKGKGREGRDKIRAGGKERTKN